MERMKEDFVFVNRKEVVEILEKYNFKRIATINLLMEEVLKLPTVELNPSIHEDDLK